MKKLLLASAIAAVSVTAFTAANAAPTVYGKAFVTVDYVDSDLDWSDEFIAQDNVRIAEANILRRAAGKDDLPFRIDLNDDEVAINSNGSRIGFKGAEPITASTDVTYQMEYGVDIDADDSKTLKQRTTYLGLRNDSLGEFRIGNLVSPLDSVNNVTVTQGYWSNLGVNNTEPTLAEAYTMSDAGRMSNSILWLAPKYNEMPLELALMYQTEEDGEDGYAASLMFDQGTGFTVGVGYDDDLAIDGDILRGTVTVDLAEMSGLPLTLGALYQKADFDTTDNDEKGFVISAEMGLANFAKPATIYAQYNNVSDLAGIEDLDSDQFVVGGKYFYQKNMIAHMYAGYNNTENKNGESDLLAVGGGLEYKF
ncbi:porin [Psychrobacter sp. FDAARGOS_221]|uniref:porin n=1 Tax=Psychrobacter sp. FDAARGOS_221 TaxID=1975705 RepID=UPI000BB57E95|nr:porin [Psychrobacter sp. FDAARGOS_221]PNK60024.1 porin [Psychrobacter sp. FDAARGOS_221]